MTFGTTHYGREPWGSGPLHDPPVITLTFPVGTLTTGGPTMTVTWDYSQPQGDPQYKKRVRFLNDAGTTVHYDSGWIEDAAHNHSVDIDAEAIPADSTDVQCEVSVQAANWSVTDAGEYVTEWGVPHITITAPDDDSITQDPDSLIVTWTFVDDRAGKTQGWWRVRLLNPATGSQLYSTSWLTGTDLTTDLEYLFTDQTDVVVEVQAKNNEGIRSD